MTEAQKRAKLKYQHEHVKQVVIQFYPKDYELLEFLRAKAVVKGGMNAYIKGLIEKDLKEQKK